MNIIIQPESQNDSIVVQFYSLLHKIAESNDRNKISNRLSAYDKVSKYAATGIKVAGIIGIICCIIIGRLRANTGKRDSTIPSVTLDKQYQECVKANE